MFRRYIAPYLPLWLVKWCDPEFACALKALDKQLNGPDKLLELATRFPEYRGRFWEQVFANPKAFQQLIQNAESLQQLASAFPDHTGEWVNWIFSDPYRVRHLLNQRGGLVAFARSFPTYRMQLLEWGFSHTVGIDCLMEAEVEFFLFGEAFPDTKQVLDCLFTYPDSIQEIMEHAQGLSFFLDESGGYQASLLFWLVHKDYTGRLMVWLLKHSETLDRTVKKVRHLVLLAKHFPHQSQNLLEWLFAAGSARFQRIVTDDKAQKELVQAFCEGPHTLGPEPSKEGLHCTLAKADPWLSTQYKSVSAGEDSQQSKIPAGRAAGCKRAF